VQCCPRVTGGRCMSYFGCKRELPARPLPQRPWGRRRIAPEIKLHERKGILQGLQHFLRHVGGLTILGKLIDEFSLPFDSSLLFLQVSHGSLTIGQRNQNALLHMTFRKNVCPRQWLSCKLCTPKRHSSECG